MKAKSKRGHNFVSWVIRKWVIESEWTWIEHSIKLWTINDWTWFRIIWDIDYFNKHKNNITKIFWTSFFKEFIKEKDFKLEKSYEDLKKEYKEKFSKSKENLSTNGQILLITRWVFEEFKEENWLYKWKDLSQIIKDIYLYNELIALSLSKKDDIPFHNFQHFLQKTNDEDIELEELELAKLFYKHCI